MKTKIHMAAVAEKLIECRNLLKQAADRISQGPEWDVLQSAMVTLESAAGSLIDSNEELDREVAKMSADSAKAVSDAVAQVSQAVKVSEVAPAGVDSGVGSFS